ncbi:UDP-N-acetylglucosamine 2-epimerase [Roseobacter sp. HKCCD5988]|uniref:UDP-N-acetylglucosamine 2-epimerase n=1 Tax=Roseobacter sp. HKCCD5988 TaxID=3120338 RepID=UPI0030EEC79B
MRKICVITGTRAEFGLLRFVLLGLKEASDVHLQLIVTGAHLVPEYGNTYDEIHSADFQIDAEVDMLLASNSSRAVGQSLGMGVIGITNALSRLSPDIIVLLGDRYEALAAAQSAMILGIPIAHIHGGEATEGLVDEAIRHSITKMSHVHFTAAEPFRKKVIQLGEHPSTVHNVGALGLDNIASLPHISRCEIEEFIGLKLDAPTLLVTYHPLTLDGCGTSSVDNLLMALAMQKDVRIVFTGANADAMGQDINARIRSFCKAKSETAVQVASLGVNRYLNLMAISDSVIGNSSSGLLEAPFLGVPSVNIGDRQRGRLTGPAVVNCSNTTEDIHAAIEKARSGELRAIAARRETPYGKPGASNKIVEILRTMNLSGILFKRFYKL